MSDMESLDFAKEVLRDVWSEFINHFDAAAVVDPLYSRKLIDDSTMDVILTAKPMKAANRAFLLHLRGNVTIESLEKLCKVLHDTAREHHRHDRLATLLEGELKQWKVPPSSHVAAQRGDKGESQPSFRSVITSTEELLPFLDHFLPNLLLLGVVLGIDNLAAAILNGMGGLDDKCLNILEMWLRRTANPTWELFCSLLQRRATFNRVRSLIEEAHDFKSESEDDSRRGPDDNVDKEFRKVIHGMSLTTGEMNVKTVIQSLRSYLNDTFPIDTDLLTALQDQQLISPDYIQPWKGLLSQGKESDARCALVDYLEKYYDYEYLTKFTDLLMEHSKKSKPILKEIAEKLRVEMGKGLSS